MKLAPILILPLVLAFASGCSNTAEGVKQDVQEDSQKAAEKMKEGIDTASNAASNASNTVKEVTGNAALTLRIKNAINADKGLNDAKNKVDVDTTDENVVLSGHVATAELKYTASTIAEEEMKKAEAKQKLKNDLMVTP